MTINYLLFLLIVGQCYFSARVTSRRKHAAEDIFVDLATNGCGQVKIDPSRNSKIVNGRDVSFGEYPWQVAFMEYDRNAWNKVYCGGSLISDQWIVTAAHCFEGMDLEEYFARLGEHDILSVNEPLPHIDRNLSEIIIHPKYDSETYQYDIELVKLQTPVTFQKNIQPICLYNQNKLLIGKFLKTSGWGLIFEDGKHSTVLQDVALPVIKNKECEKMFFEGGNFTPVGKMFICAGFKNGKFDTCSGDSGGPLQMQMKNGRWALVGIVSWGYGCGRYLKPGLFTRVSMVTPWIVENVADEDDYLL